MTYSLTGLDPSQFAHLFGQTTDVLAVQGVIRMTSQTYPDLPCRITLDDIHPGQTLLLLNHISHKGGPFQASNAIFVTEGKEEAARFVDEVPPALDRRMLSIRAFDSDGMMVDAAIAQIGQADGIIRQLLGNPIVDHLDAHNATRGCFAARVERS